jgi:hypothetical protein
MRVTLKSTVMGLVVALMLLVVGCGGSGTTEIAGDKDEGGPLPTAPDGSPRNASDGDPFSGSVDANELIRRIEALSDETDLCTLLTGQAMADIAAADINLAGLASNPSGFSALFAALDKLFGHMLTIGPPEVEQPLSTLQAVWGGLADIDIRATDAEGTAAALLAGEDTQAANDALAEWVTGNCRSS